VQPEKVVPEVRKEIPHRIPDANVVKLGLGNLGRAVDEVMTGDPTHCSGKERFTLPRTQRTRFTRHDTRTTAHAHTHTTHATGCEAILSARSVLTRRLDATDEAEWECEFCGHTQTVHVGEGEVPTSDQYEHVLEMPEGQADDNKPLIVFCIDISGMAHHIPHSTLPPNGPLKATLTSCVVTSQVRCV
jgi:hypothetical protein